MFRGIVDAFGFMVGRRASRSNERSAEAMTIVMMADLRTAGELGMHYD